MWLPRDTFGSEMRFFEFAVECLRGKLPVALRMFSYKSVPDQFCLVCGPGVVEDIPHFITRCPLTVGALASWANFGRRSGLMRGAWAQALSLPHFGVLLPPEGTSRKIRFWAAGWWTILCEVFRLHPRWQREYQISAVIPKRTWAGRTADVGASTSGTNK